MQNADEKENTLPVCNMAPYNTVRIGSPFRWHSFQMLCKFIANRVKSFLGKGKTSDTILATCGVNSTLNPKIASRRMRPVVAERKQHTTAR